MRMFVLIAVICSAALGFAQSCPRDDADDAATPSKLHGTIQSHDELRQWIGLKLDKPACGQPEVQLVQRKNDVIRKTKSLRGCAVTVTGRLYIPVTGYYSLKLATQDPKIEPDASCKPHPIAPDLSKKKIPAALKIYTAKITVDHRGKGHMELQAEEPSAEGPDPLTPTEAYIHFWLNGAADLLWIGCAEGFKVEDVQRDGKPLPDAKAGCFHRDDCAIEDGPKDMLGANLDEDGVNTISYTCERR